MVEEISEVRRLICTAEVKRAVELTAKLAANASLGDISMYSDLIRKSPKERRLEYAKAIRRSADRLRAYAEVMESEAK